MIKDDLKGVENIWMSLHLPTHPLQDCVFFPCPCSEDRIRNGCKKIVKSRQGSTQGRLDSFFTVTGSLSSKRKVAALNNRPFFWAVGAALPLNLFVFVCLPDAGTRGERIRKEEAEDWSRSGQIQEVQIEPKLLACVISVEMFSCWSTTFVISLNRIKVALFQLSILTHCQDESHPGFTDIVYSHKQPEEESQTSVRIISRDKYTGWILSCMKAFSFKLLSFFFNQTHVAVKQREGWLLDLKQPLLSSQGVRSLE